MQVIYSFKVDEEQTIVLIHCIPEGQDGGKETYQYIFITKNLPILSRNVELVAGEFHWMLEQCIRNGYQLEQ